MEEIFDNSFLYDEGSQAPSTLERATLTRRPKKLSKNIKINQKTESKMKSQSSSPGESSTFWALIGVMLLLAAGNLILTFFAMGVLRLGTGMESIEFHPLTKVTKFFGLADLGTIQKKDGTIFGFADSPFSIHGVNSKVSLSLHTKKPPPRIEVGPQKIEINNVKEFKVLEPTTGNTIFTTKYPNFGLPRSVQNLHVKRSRTARITSPINEDLEIQSDNTIRLKGNEGLKLEAKKLTFAADKDVYLNTLNGSIILEGGSGIFVEVNTLPLAGPVDMNEDRGQYKLCICLPMYQLFRVPVPRDNHLRSKNQITCSTFANPCMRAF